jgi:tetratricopeptide (TPR) repeat protein
MGIVHSIRVEHDRALECFTEHERICRELGDRRGLATAIGNMSLVFYDRGEYDRVLECYGEQQRICLEIGDRNGELGAIGNIGLVHEERGEFDLALEHLRHAAGGHRAMGSRHGLTHWLVGTARLLVGLAAKGGSMPGYLARHLPDVTSETWRAISLRVARESAGECLAISRELSTPDTLYTSRVLLARIDAAEGNTIAARESLQRMLEEAGDDEKRADLQYWLWRIEAKDEGGRMKDESRGVDSSSSSAGHHADALRLYESLLEIASKHEYRARIEELSAAMNSDQAGDRPAMVGDRE